MPELVSNNKVLKYKESEIEKVLRAHFAKEHKVPEEAVSIHFDLKSGYEDYDDRYPTTRFDGITVTIRNDGTI